MMLIFASFGLSTGGLGSFGLSAGGLGPASIAHRASNLFHNNILEKRQLSLSTNPSSSPHVADSLASVHLDVPDPGLPRSQGERGVSQALEPVMDLPTTRPSARSTVVSTSVPIVINPGKVPFVPPSPVELYRTMPQTLELAYKAEATFANVLFFLIRDDWLLPAILGIDGEMIDREGLILDLLSNMQPDYEAIITMVPKLRGVDFSALSQPRYGYADQVTIDKTRVWLLAAWAVYYGLDFGLVVRFISSEVTASHRDVEAILSAARPYVDSNNLVHMRRILERGCPAQFSWEEPD